MKKIRRGLERFVFDLSALSRKSYSIQDIHDLFNGIENHDEKVFYAYQRFSKNIKNSIMDRTAAEVMLAYLRSQDKEKPNDVAILTELDEAISRYDFCGALPISKQKLHYLRADLNFNQRLATHPEVIEEIIADVESDKEYQYLSQINTPPADILLTVKAYYLNQDFEKLIKFFEGIKKLPISEFSNKNFGSARIELYSLIAQLMLKKSDCFLSKDNLDDDGDRFNEVGWGVLTKSTATADIAYLNLGTISKTLQGIRTPKMQFFCDYFSALRNNADVSSLTYEVSYKMRELCEIAELTLPQMVVSDLNVLLCLYQAWSNDYYQYRDVLPTLGRYILDNIQQDPILASSKHGQFFINKIKDDHALNRHGPRLFAYMKQEINTDVMIISNRI